MKERELWRQREEPAPPPTLYLYLQRQQAKISGTKTHVTLAISSLRCHIAPRGWVTELRHHGAERTAASPTQHFCDISHFGHLCQRSVFVHECVADHVLMCTENAHLTARYVCLYN